MPLTELTAADRDLIAAARATLSAHYRPHWHMVAAALRGTDGRIFTGIHLGATVGRLQICAEPIALGQAVLAGSRIATAVAVRHPKPDEPDQSLCVVPPCGACRELFADHAADAWIIVSEHEKHPATTLLPQPYRR